MLLGDLGVLGRGFGFLVLGDLDLRGFGLRVTTGGLRGFGLRFGLRFNSRNSSSASACSSSSSDLTVAACEMKSINAMERYPSTCITLILIKRGYSRKILLGYKTDIKN